MICSECATHEPLKKLLEKHGRMGQCRYCKRHGNTMESRKLFDYIFERVSENVACRDDLTDYELAMLYEGGSDFIAVEEIDMVLMEWFELGDTPYFEDLLAEVPSEFITDNDGYSVHFYSDDGDLEKNIYEMLWEMFVDNIQHKYRFFNPDAHRFLDDVFSPLISTGHELKPEVIRTITKGETLYRARCAKGEKDAKEIIGNATSQFGPTPKHMAGSQRMTPSGISGLYCALDRETCLSEIRSITGDYVISVGLTPVTEIKLLDLTALNLIEPPELTFLDKGYRKASHRQVFLSSLVRKLSRPKARNDELSYLSTQVVFEYLRQRFDQQVVGLVFPSVQTGETGTNVVIFPEYSLLGSEPLTVNDADNEHEKNFGFDISSNITTTNKDQSPFVQNQKLLIMQKSIRFHKITAIQTSAKEYDDIYDIFMDELTRRRLGPSFQ